jgi:hypothetical protein
MASLMPFLTVAGSGIAIAAGALAFGQNFGTHAWSSGYAFNYATPAEAQKSAMAHCRSRPAAGSYCKVIATINGRCLAIAVQDGGNGYGWNTASSIPQAQKLAMGSCEVYGKSCSVRDSFCDTISSSPITTPPAATPAPASPPGTTPGGGSPACQKFPNLC